MLRLNYGNLFQDWELGIARELVDKFKKKYNCLKNEDFEDLLQECLAEWVFAKTKYDPTYKVPPKTHMGRVVRNVLINIIRKKKTDKRKLEYLSDSLDRPLNTSQGMILFQRGFYIRNFLISSLRSKYS